MADVLAWPELPTGVCAALKQWYRSPLQQQAAFDDVAGAFELLEFCHLGLDPVALVSCANILVDWQQSSQARFKRARASAVLDMRERLTLPQQVRPNPQAVYESFVKLSPAAVLAMHEKQKAARRSDPVTRNSLEESEKLRYALLLGNFVDEADLPVAREIRELDDSDQALHCRSSMRN